MTEVVAAAPQAVFGLACLWYLMQVLKEYAAAQSRYAAQLESVNKLYMELLERAVLAIATNAKQSSDNGSLIARLHQDFVEFRSDLHAEIEVLRDQIDRSSGGSGDRNEANSRRPRTRGSAD